MPDYQSKLKSHVAKPGFRCYAAGFRLSNPPTKNIRNMPPALVEFVCGGKTEAQEIEMREGRTLVHSVAPVLPDGTVLLKKTTTHNDLEFFTDIADAQAYYDDCLDRAIRNIDLHLAALTNLKNTVLNLQNNTQKGE